MPYTKKTQALARLALLVTAIIWGSAFVVVKNTVDVFPPCILVAIRFTVAASLLALVYMKKLRASGLRPFVKGGVIGVFLFAAYAVQTIGLTDTTPGKNAFLTAIYCVLVPFINWVVCKKRPLMRHVLAAFICIAGIGLVSLTENLTVGMGDALTLVGGLLFAVQIVAVAKLGANEDPVIITIGQFASCALLGWIFGFAAETIPSGVPMDSLWGLAYLSVISTAVALLLQNVGQKYTDPSSASILMSLEAVFGVLFSMFFYGEQIYTKMVIGFALIFAAIVISEIEPKRRQISN